MRNQASKIVGLLFFLLLLLGSWNVSAQSGGPYEISRSYVGSVADSSGGDYTLIGTIGQADAGTLSGGALTLVGGFWGGDSAAAAPGAGNTSVYLPLVIRQ